MNEPRIVTLKEILENAENELWMENHKKVVSQAYAHTVDEIQKHLSPEQFEFLRLMIQGNCWRYGEGGDSCFEYCSEKECPFYKTKR